MLPLFLFFFILLILINNLMFTKHKLKAADAALTLITLEYLL